MRVLHVYSGNLYGGIESILVSLARTGGSGGTAHEFALCFEGRLSRELAATGAGVHQLGPVRLSRPQTARRARTALSQLLGGDGTRRFDRVICHAPWSQAILGGIAKRCGVPLAFWAHDRMTGCHWTERLARRNVPDLVICNSHYTASTLPALYPEAPSAVVYAPVAPANPQPAAVRRRLRQEADTADSDVVIVQASRLEAWKGHETLVHALATLRDLPGWVLWVAGGAQRDSEARYLEHLKARAESSGIGDRVRWLGDREDLRTLLGACDIYCQANLAPEPFGVAFIEALWAGLPVITPDLGGAREIVTSEVGILVAPADRQAMALALAGLVQSPERRTFMGSSGPDRARSLCDPVQQANRLDSILRQMACEAVA
jgi:glycosyltransferase involved in cell wall biosynthesis